MSITFDGHRSMLRLYRARRLLSTCKAIGLPALTREEGGFRFQVTNLDSNLEIGRVTAPEGLVVACVDSEKLSVSYADYWVAPVLPARRYSRLDGDKSAQQVVIHRAILGVVPNTPLLPKATFTSFPPLYSTYPDAPPKPALRPWAAEMYCLDYTMACTDVNCSTSSDVLFYCTDGTVDKKLIAATLTNNTTWKPVIQCLPSTVADSRAILHTLGRYYWPADAGPNSIDMICAYMSQVKSEGNGYFSVGFALFTSYVMFNQLPPGLMVALSRQTPNYTVCLGSYGFSLASTKSPTLLQAVDATHPMLDVLYFSNNPEHAQWKLFLCIYDAEQNTILNFGAVPFVEAFYNLSGVMGGAANAFPASYPPDDHAMWTDKIANMKLWRTGGQGGDGVYVPIYTPIYDNAEPPNVIQYNRTGWSINWDRVRMGVAQWFAWPNNNPWAAYDSAMFHDHYGSVLTWTRMFGTVRINSTIGAIRTNIVVPSAANAVGVRPEIYLVKDSLYWCRCVEEFWGVRGLYLGSPYSGWVEVPQLPGYRMVEARLAAYNNGLADCVFLGVFSDGADYYTGVFSEQAWRLTGKIQDAGGFPGSTAWAITTYGDGPLSSNMREHSAQPPATPQRSVCGDYSQYEAML